MNRDHSLQALEKKDRWDILVIGGGASGLGAAVDAASRGYRTLLLEQHDFAKGTSSRSTKLIHGGVRYLKQGNVSLVRESLRERAILLRNAPHLTRQQTFIIPAYASTDRLFYGIGLRLYDALAGKLGLGPSKIISREETLAALPTVQPDKLRGGVQYFDGQFDDARLAICLAQTLHDLGGFALNYVRIDQFLKQNGRIVGVVARDVEAGAEFQVQARVVINATGVFTDSVRRLDGAQTETLVTPSQGSHIVVDRSFLPGGNALMIPKTKDGRVMFAIPWHGRVLIGTTDSAVKTTSLEPRPLALEIEFLLEHAATYLARAPGDHDIVSMFAGLRPLVKTGGQNTARLSRDHAIFISDAGLVTITGGKWTTYRKMGKDVVTLAAEVAGLEQRTSETQDLRLHGAESESIFEIYEEGAASGLTPPSTQRIVRFVREEMARTVEDVLARRTRMLVLNPRAAMEIAPMVAEALARELDRDPEWKTLQIDSFRELAQTYLWK